MFVSSFSCFYFFFRTVSSDWTIISNVSIDIICTWFRINRNKIVLICGCKTWIQLLFHWCLAHIYAIEMRFGFPNHNIYTIQCWTEKRRQNKRERKAYVRINSQHSLFKIDFIFSFDFLVLDWCQRIDMFVNFWSVRPDGSDGMDKYPNILQIKMVIFCSSIRSYSQPV